MDEKEEKTCNILLPLKPQVLCFQSMIELIAIWPVLGFTVKSRKSKGT